MLILTNLPWVRNPYVSATKMRPNPTLFRTAMFNFTTIQAGRELTDEEVNQINFITKRRAYRYIAAASEEDLYPEKRIPSEHWRKLNDNYLLMPDPRSVTFTDEVVVGYTSGAANRFDAYGHRPGQKGFKQEGYSEGERNAHYRFQGEYARLFGKKRRGITCEFGREKLETGGYPGLAAVAAGAYRRHPVHEKAAVRRTAWVLPVSSRDELSRALPDQRET
jgi:hypothetical protein